MPSLADRLKALGVKTGAAGLAPPARAESFGIHTVMAGQILTTDMGETFVYEERFAADYRHGHAAIRPSAPLTIVSTWAADERLRDLPIEAFAFLDTETSGLAGGTGTYAFLVGAARFDEQGEFVLHQFFMRDPSEEPALLEALTHFLAPAQALVTFNGKAFDAPLLNTRYSDAPHAQPDAGVCASGPAAAGAPAVARSAGVRAPSSTSKRTYSRRPAASKRCPAMRSRTSTSTTCAPATPARSKGVFYHNAMDVVAMAALLSHTATMLADPFHEGIEHGLDVIAMARLYEHLGQGETAARLFERGLQMDLGQEYFWEAVRRLSVLQKRRGDFEQAIPLWEQAAAEGHVYAFIELAKFHEHRRRDPAAALEWTRLALKQLKHADMPGYVRKHWEQELRHRRERLEARTRKR